MDTTTRKKQITHPASISGKKIVTIIGGGFAGLAAAKKLANKTGLYVILIDEKNYHLFQPLLYQVATAGLSPSDIAVPIRSQFANADNVEIHMKKVSGINLQEKFVVIENYEFKSDYIIVACGAKHSYFSHPEWEDYAPGLKTLAQATEIRRRILSAFEHAESEEDPAIQKELLTFVIVGGGPTGVELAGAIAEISTLVFINDFKRISSANSRIILLEGGERLLSGFHEELSTKTKTDLEELGVEVFTKTYVTNITPEGVYFENNLIKTQNIFWAAGVKSSNLNFVPNIEQDKSGRIVVDENFAIPDFPDVFILGDMAAYKITDGELLPALAPVAIQGGKFVAEFISNSLEGRNVSPFVYRDKGLMATIGKNKAVAQVFSLNVTGRLAWFAWLFIHILYLIGFKNRVFVLFQWASGYIFSKRGARLITEKDWKIYKN